jgi:hypothetical protein
VEAELLAVDVQASYLQYIKEETAHDQSILLWQSDYILHEYATPTESNNIFLPKQQAE